MTDVLKTEEYVAGDAINTVWGRGHIQSYRECDNLYIVLLDNWKLAQGQSPTLYLASESMTKVSASFQAGDAVNTVWGAGRVQSYRASDGLYIVLLNHWKLAQGQSPTLFLGAEALKPADSLSNEFKSEEIKSEINADRMEEEDDDDDDDMLPPTLLRHITIEEDSLPPLPLMIRLASHNAAKQKVACCICDDLVLHGVGHLRLGCRCLCHETCFVAYIRSKSRADWGRAGGIACPYALGAEMCEFKGQNNEPYRITPYDLSQMVKLLGTADRLSTTAEPSFISDSLITLDEIEKYETWIVEMQQAGETLTDNADDKDLVFTAEDEASKRFVEATSKACPKCSLRATHYHGHSCHHIYGGCERCQEEYCYRCLSTATENTEERGDRTCCPCGSWETFCNNEDLGFFLVLEPYPHDSRCGCIICPDCRPSNPCDMCDGSCAVCDGLIEPPPLDLDALADWKHNCKSDDLAPGSVYISGSMILDVNGVYMPAMDDEYDSEEHMPIYSKKIYEDEDDCCVQLACKEMEDGGWCWCLQHEGESDSKLAYVKMDHDSIFLPGRDPMPHPWEVKINEDFREKSEVSMRLLQPEIDIPEDMLKRFERGKADILEQRAQYLAELNRDPFPGSVVVSGLSGQHEKANGVYEPTPLEPDTVAMVIYRLKGHKTMSLEFLQDSFGCAWRLRDGEKAALAFEASCVRTDDRDVFTPIDTVSLPHARGKDTVWMVSGDKQDYMPQRDVSVALYYPDAESVPSSVTGDVAAMQEKVSALLDAHRVEAQRASCEGAFSLSLSYGVGSLQEFPLPLYLHHYRCGGTYEPTTTLKNGLPLYVKKGDADVTLRYAGNQRWEIVAPVVKSEGSALNIIARCALVADKYLAAQSSAYSWTFSSPQNPYTFLKSPSCIVIPASKPLLPPNVMELLSDSFKSKLRDPLPGSVVIQGAAGSRASRMNGIFEPTSEVYNGMPVYQKKDDDGTWMELVTGTTGGLRWYVKPTSSRGPGSTCFGYLDQVKANLLLPHETGEKHWHVYDGSSFVTQNNAITSALCDPLEPIPASMLELLEAKRTELAVLVAEKEALMAKPPIPGSVSIEGATGSRAYGVNGIFEPTEELYNSLPCYKKKGEDIWLEMVHGASGYRWYIKPVANRGSSSVCFAYCKFDEENPTLPFDRTQERWRVYDGKEFVDQATVVTKLVPENEPVPETQLRLLADCKADMAVKIAEKKAKLAIPPVPGSFTLAGATGSREHRVNGIFEPTDEVQNGMPVYQKRGDEDTWMELVSGKSGWRWYIKPTKEKGPTSSICYAYRGVKPENINLPQSCTEVGWTVYNGKAFVLQSDVTCELSLDGVAVPQNLLDMVEAKLQKNEDDEKKDDEKKDDEKKDDEKKDDEKKDDDKKDDQTDY